MKAQRKEYGESPVIPISYPAGSPYATAAAAPARSMAAGQGLGTGTRPAGQAGTASAEQAASQGAQS
jgi:hypothetical protein